MKNPTYHPARIHDCAPPGDCSAFPYLSRIVFVAFCLLVSAVSPLRAETWEAMLTNTWILDIATDSNGTVWMAGGNIYRYDHGEMTTYYYGDDLPDTHMCDYGIVVDSLDHVWSGGDNGLSYFDGETWHGVYRSSGIDDAITVVALGNDDEIWIGTQNAGAGVYDGYSWTWYTVEDGLGNNSVNEILVDREGVVWIGTFGSRLSRFDGESWRTFTVEDGLPGNGITALYADRDNTLWCGSGSNVSTYDGVTWTARDLGLERIDRYNYKNIGIKDIDEDSEGTIWVAGGRGMGSGSPCDFHTIGAIARFDGEEWTLFSKEGGMPNDGITCMTVRNDGAVCFGTICGSFIMYPNEPIDVADQEEHPSEIRITGNYPNPFNPSTTIECCIPVSTDVNLDVYSTSGQKIATLVDDFRAAGTHSVVFDGSGCASGLYLYRLNAGGIIKSGKMMLVK